MHIYCLFAAMLCGAASQVIADDILRIGSPAPNFSPDTFLRGVPIRSLERGQWYVIEFSGTQCGPCIQAIPLIEELQQEHKDVTFITVFSQKESIVREFLAGAGAKMSTRILLDETGAIEKDWLIRSRYPGIPCFFVVDSDLSVAWFGPPDHLAEVLQQAKTAEGLSPLALMRFELFQCAAERSRQASERIDNAHSELSDIVKVINQSDHAGAVKALTDAMARYCDQPDFVERCRTLKLCEMAYVPGTREVALELAKDIAADGLNAGEWRNAAALSQHYRQSLPVNQNLDVVYLALALLKSSDVPEGSDLDQLSSRSGYFATLADCYQIIGDRQLEKESLALSLSAGENYLKEAIRTEAHPLTISNWTQAIEKSKEKLEALQ